ncbi:MAG: recombination-associated protein RdgC [Myxococcota bacterium]
MPLLRGNLSLARFTVEPKPSAPKDLRRSAGKALKRKAFQPIDINGEDDRSLGWVEVEDSESSEFAGERLLFGEHLLFSLRVDRLRVPTSVVKNELNAWANAYEKENGYAPKRSEKKNQKELIERKLKKRAFPSRKIFDVSWNTSSQVLCIWATAAAAVEEIHLLIEETFEVRLHPMTPGAIAEAADLPRGALTPTADLIGAVLSKEVGGE